MRMMSSRASKGLEIIVGAAFEALHAVAGGAACCQHDDCDDKSFSPQVAAEGHAIAVG
jgi:hypothetical protein